MENAGRAGLHGIVLRVEGKGAEDLVQEAGGHRVQRIPANEKRGRVHTSTVTVAALDGTATDVSPFSRRSGSDFRVEWFRGSGAGGQHRNKHANSARVIHLPTGLKQERQGRKRESNLAEATEALTRVLDERMRDALHGTASSERSKQIGSGMRGDKSVTIRFQDDRAQHHGTGKTMKASLYMKGFMDELWS